MHRDEPNGKLSKERHEMQYNRSSKGTGNEITQKTNDGLNKSTQTPR
jgi:hypothetical protein